METWPCRGWVAVGCHRSGGDSRAGLCPGKRTPEVQVGPCPLMGGLGQR